MSRARTCSGSGLSNGDNASGIRASATNAPQNAPSRNNRPNHESKRSRSKNKIPRSVRYDLENSLVGLCDVWFEEIKPHLVRNNIKLHVHGGEEHPTPSAGCASGDFEQQPTLQSCSHLDPGAALDLQRHKVANYVGSCSTRRTASKAPSPKLRTPTPRQDRPPTALTTQTPRKNVQIQRPTSETTQVLRPHRIAVHSRRKKRITQPQSSSKYQVPRLCRAKSVISAAVNQLRPRVDDACVRELFKSVYNKAPLVLSRHRWKATQKDRSTQTAAPASRPLAATVVNVVSPTKSPGRRMPSPNTRSSHRYSDITHHQSYHKPYPNQPTIKESVVFEDDLIDIIGEKHEERMKMIYNSPEQVKYSSVMNLVSPNNRQKKGNGPKKIPPWR